VFGKIFSNVKGFHGQIKRQTLYYVDT